MVKDTATTAPAAPPPTPPAPPPLDDEPLRSLLGLARTLAFLVALVAGLFFLILLALGIFRIAVGGSPASLVAAAYCLIAAAVNYLTWRELPALELLASQRKYGLLKERLIVWTVLGLIFFVVVGVVLALAWVRIDLKAGPYAAAPTGNPPVCLRCGERATLIPEFGRYYCYRCSAYLW
ncbi:MAG TPA: hypothetical protein VK455_06085 [Thermoplasmata archaeon]|nr:hypothetical protein [Thermoplasmata archaeon]